MGAFIRRCFLLIVLVCTLGDSRCKSYPIKEEIKEQRNENEKAKEIAKAYIPAGPDQERVIRALDGSSELLTKTGEEAEKEKARADKNQGAADFIFWGKILGGIAIAGCGWYCLKKFGQGLPVIGKFL